MSHEPAPLLSPREQLGALRILDANYNRAAEGLRVVEEYCRFVLADRHLTRLCKSLRHELAEVLAAIPTAELANARDTPADVGTSVKTEQEFSRDSLRAVAVANWRRVEQALRALEEYAKVLQIEQAGRFEQFRYQSYTLAKACDITDESLNRLAHARLYVLLDGGSSSAAFAERARHVVHAGAHVVQLREKRLDDRTLLARARALREIVFAAATGDAQGQRPLLIVNDRPDIAVLARADGVHLGQDELSLRDARSIVGPEMLIGISTHTLAQARQAVLDGASYIGCGPTFPSGTKPFSEFPGLDFLREVAAEISLPAFAIGGIDRQNLPAVLATGFTRIAVSGAVANSPNAADEVKQLLSALKPH